MTTVPDHDLSHRSAAPVRLRRRSLSSEPAAPLPADRLALLHRLYRFRGLSGTADNRLRLEDLHPPDSLLDIRPASERVADLVQQGGAILIVGDYDADGATGSALAVRALRAMGAARVTYLVPSRFKNGYGISPAVVEAAQSWQPDLILTVDNGIAAMDAVERAKALGIPILVTDHHLAGECLPAAVAIVNPNRPGDPFPSKHLAGVGVVFYLLAAVRARLRERGWFSNRPMPTLMEWIDLVALGTVADVVPLDRNNRILVKHGLRRLRAGNGTPGVRALLKAAKRNPEQASAQDLGFYAGPRLNAAGRLEDMSLGIECLLADDPQKARELAQQLNALNSRRRDIENQMRRQAEARLEVLLREVEDMPPGLCLYDPEWHEGVVGILASRVRDRWHRPAILFARAQNGQLRGSGRGIPELHLRDLLDTLNRRHPGLMLHFGGHAAAAGLSLHESAFEAFATAFSATIQDVAGDLPLARELLSDGELPHQALCLETAELLDDSGPWGKDFPEPLFDGEFQVLNCWPVGQDRGHLRLLVSPVGSGGQSLNAIAFRQGSKMEGSRHRVHLAYRLDINLYRGERTLQLMVEHLEWLN